MAYVSMSDLAQFTASTRDAQIQALETNASALETQATALASVQPAAAAALRASAAGMRATITGLRGRIVEAEIPWTTKLMRMAVSPAISPLGMGLGLLGVVGGTWAYSRKK